MILKKIINKRVNLKNKVHIRMQCEFCKKMYKNMYILSHHQKTTKSCLLLQCKIEKKINLDCSFCKKTFTNSFNLNRHYSTCVDKIIEEKKQEQVKEHSKIELEKDEKIKKLEEQLRIKEQNEINLELKIKELEKYKHKISHTHIDTQHITNNNNINIYQVMTPEHVLEVFQKHYSLDTLLGGQKALARFVNEEFLKKQATPVYVCGDRSRQKFYMIKDGKREEDPDCQHIIGLSTPGLPHVRDVYEVALFNTHEEITEEDIQENYRTIVNMDKERTQFKSEMSKITTNSDASETTPWEKAVKQLQIMRENLLPYETEKQQ